MTANTQANFSFPEVLPELRMINIGNNHNKAKIAKPIKKIKVAEFSVKNSILQCLSFSKLS